MWDINKYESEKIGIEEIGEASATFEHCFEFWGTWKVKKPESGFLKKNIVLFSENNYIFIYIRVLNRQKR